MHGARRTRWVGRAVVGALAIVLSPVMLWFQISIPLVTNYAASVAMFAYGLLCVAKASHERRLWLRDPHRHSGSWLRRWLRTDMQELTTGVFGIAIALGFLSSLCPRWQGRKALEGNGCAGGPYGGRILYFHTRDDDLLFAIAQPDSKPVFSMSGSQGLGTPEGQVYSPFEIHFGEHTVRLAYDETARSLEIKGRRYDLRRGLIFELTEVDGRPVFEQQAIAIDTERFRRDGYSYLLNALGENAASRVE